MLRWVCSPANPNRLRPSRLARQLVQFRLWAVESARILPAFIAGSGVNPGMPPRTRSHNLTAALPELGRFRGARSSLTGIGRVRQSQSRPSVEPSQVNGRTRMSEIDADGARLT